MTRSTAGVAVVAATVVVGATVAVASAPSTSRPDVVLVVIDTLRADHLPMYGYGRDTAPFMRSLSERGVLFETVYSTSSWTPPAVASIMTSLDPAQHGMVSGLDAADQRIRERRAVPIRVVPAAVDTIAELLRRGGYATFGLSDNPHVTRGLGFAQGFDQFVTTRYAGGAEVNRQLRRWRDQALGDEPYFLYVHYMDPHVPYHRQSPWHERYAAEADGGDLEVAAYDSEINHVDRQIEEAFGLFGWRENTLVVITSDHGEEFLEHGSRGHGYGLFNETVRVPLIVSFPQDRRFSAAVVRDPASVLDVLPTILEAVGLEVPASCRGVAWGPALGDGAEERRIERAFLLHLFRFQEILVARRGQLGFEPTADLHLEGIVKGRWKWIAGSPHGPALFDLAADPGETRSQHRRRRRIGRELQREMRRLVDELSRSAPETTELEIGEADLERLKALGYL